MGAEKEADNSSSRGNSLVVDKLQEPGMSPVGVEFRALKCVNRRCRFFYKAP